MLAIAPCRPVATRPRLPGPGVPGDVFRPFHGHEYRIQNAEYYSTEHRIQNAEAPSVKCDVMAADRPASRAVGLGCRRCSPVTVCFPSWPPSLAASLDDERWVVTHRKTLLSGCDR